MNQSGETPFDDASGPEAPVEEIALSGGPGSTNPHVEALAHSIGPRSPGSSEETLAAGYLVDALAEQEIPAATLKTSVPRFADLPDMLLALFAFLAMVVTVFIPVLGIVLLVLVLLAHVGEHQGILKLSRFLPTTASVNVLAIIPPAESEIRRVILTSTLDTGRVGVLSRRHLGYLYPWLHVVALGATGVSALLAIVLLADSGNTRQPLHVLPAIVVLIVLALLTEREVRREASPGAITNASGVASMIEAAGLIEGCPPRWLEIWLLGVGASTGRSGGMSDFLSKNTFDPDTTYFVHLYGPGGGAVTVPRSVGAGLRSTPAAPLLAWIFDSVAPAPASTRQRLTAQTVAQATHRAGYQTIVIAGVDEQGKVPFLDSDQDLPYRVRDEAIGESARLVHDAIAAFDQEVAARAALARSTASIEDVSELAPTTPEMPADRL